MAEKTVKQKLLVILAIIGCAFLMTFTLSNLIIVVRVVIDSKTVPGVFGFKPLIVMTDKIESKTKKGDLIFISSVDKSKLKAGDVICIREDDDSLSIYRIARLTTINGETAFVTELDVKREGVYVVPYDQVQGVMVGKIPKGGNIILFMKTPLGMILCLGIPITFWIIYEIVMRKINKKIADINNDAYHLERQRRMFAGVNGIKR